MTILLPPPKILNFLLITITILVIFYTITQFFAFQTDHKWVFGLVTLFYLGGEGNLPAFFSSMILLFTAALLLVIGAEKRNTGDQFSFHWLLLGVIFAFLALDEIAQLHEILGRVLHRLLDTSGIFFFAWVIPYLAFVIVLAVAYLKFLLHLPARTRNLMIVSGLIYVSAAIGLEFLQALEFDKYRLITKDWVILVTIEETCEMVGVTMMIYALLDYMKHGQSEIPITLKIPQSQSD